MKRLSSFEDLKPKSELCTITNSATGEEWGVNLLELTNEETSEINSQIRYPTPPVKGFKGKNQVTGEPIPEFDEQDPKYRNELMAASRKHVFLWLLKSWDDVPIPGETIDEKMAALEKGIPNWAFLEFQNRLQELHGFRQSEVAFQKKKLQENPFGEPSTKSANDGDGA